MSTKHVNLLRHALGIRKTGDTPFRNHFVTGPGSTDFDGCEALVADGLMTKAAGNVLTGGDPCYFATKAGIAAATEGAKPTFHVRCSGCQARKALMPVLTDAQVAGADSTFQTLEKS